MSSTEAPDYSSTVNLPKTDFPQKADLANREPQRLARWQALRIDEQLSARTDSPEFILHDGPPYANGDIHIGHALNKILKDIVVRYKTMAGFRSRYVPGWDCHGLPIEQKVVDKLREEKAYAGKSPIEIRQLCAAYARKWIDIQREQFKRLGVGGDWDHPYITMEPKFEAGILRAFADLVKKGYVYKGLKVVHWDPIFETALAEAEIEHEDKHVSPAIYVKFPFKSKPPVASLQGGNASAVIWTTTPWTLPANLGVCFHAQYDYVAYELNGEVYVVAKALLNSFIAETGLEGGKVLETFEGKLLDRQACKHPLLEKDSLCMLGEHVTLDTGTGAVHTAPGHGVEDFEVGRHYGLPVFNPVDERGCFTDDFPAMKGMNIFKANPLIIEKLKESGLLLGHKPLTHSYPYSTRTRKPVIMRATEQWFMEIDKAGLRERTLEATKKVEWIPGWGFDRIHNMLKGRPDWCLSRQRSWGVPIPSLLDKRTRKSVLLPEVMDAFIALAATEGTDAWYTRPVEDFLPAAMKAEASHYEKEFNCLDVWFDSGSTHCAVLNKEYGLTWPADLYLEGSDQHRGWFQSSMWVAMGVFGAPPYRAVLTHGFVLDEKGIAMSKSLGNGVSPLDVVKQNGADVLRMWVSSEDYSGDVRIGKAALEQIANAYRRIRNTLRYCLSNLYDFDPAKDAVPHAQLGEDDRWALHKLNELCKAVGQAYESYEFHRVYQAVNNFCVTELGSLYLDMVKDRLYCEDTAGTLRRASQTVLHHLAATMARLLAPILAFTADEAWEFLPGAHTVSVHLEKFPAPRAEWQDDALAAKWERLLAVRNEATKQFDRLRGNAPGAKEKVIGGSVDAKLVLRSRDAETLAFLRANRAVLETLCIVSHVAVLEEDAPALEELKAHGLAVAVEAGKADGGKCPRCRRWSVTVGHDPKHPELDARCAEVLKRSA